MVGVSRVDITRDYPIRLHGFGGRREEVRQRLFAKALASSRALTFRARDLRSDPFPCGRTPRHG